MAPFDAASPRVGVSARFLGFLASPIEDAVRLAAFGHRAQLLVKRDDTGAPAFDRITLRSTRDVLATTRATGADSVIGASDGVSL